MADPDRILLFGSFARGTADERSDIDLILVHDLRPSGAGRRKTIAQVRRALPRVGRAYDVLLFTPAEVARWRHTLNHVVAIAFREGKTLYAGERER